MSLGVQAGLLLSVATAFVSILGFLYKHRGAVDAPPVDARHPVRSTIALFSNRWWTLGIIVATGSWFLHTAALGGITEHDLSLARSVTGALAAQSLHTAPGDGVAVPQTIEIAIDALDIAAVRPFWKAVTGYADEPGANDLPDGALVDPLRRGPAIWFQQMDEPRIQRNRIHLDVDVPVESAGPRIDGALAAGGRLVSADAAPAFWVLADVEGNEVCVCTWQGRD